jgi:hypothetical protein
MREAFSRFKTSTTLLRRIRSAPKLAAALVLLSSVATATFVFCVPSQNALHAQTLSTAQPSSPRVDSGPAEPTLTLSPQDKARIRAEEIFREEVRREIEANNPKQSPQDNAWSILNSSFALWFLSSVVVAGITAAFAKYQKNHSARMQKNEIQRRIQTEVSSRIAEGLIAMRLDLKRIDKGQAFWATSIYNEALSYLDNQVTDGTKILDFSSYSEYRFRKLRSLLFELTSVAEKSAHTQLSAIKERYAKLIELADVTSMGEDYSKSPDMSVTLDAVKKATEILESLQANALWQAQL